ncbi:MAG: nitroreductase, partial [Verrucomicrobia bacterium]
MKLDSPEASRFRELVRRSRSIRRFQESRPVSADVLRRLVDCARLVPSAANLQPLRYVLCNDP